MKFHHLPIAPETKSDAEWDLRNLIKEHDVDLVVLARYMQILSPELCAELTEKIINVHHSLLPAFVGANTYRRAHERGVKIIGATAHYVTDDLDAGPIIDQEAIRIDDASTPGHLAKIGQTTECVALSRAVQWHCEHRIMTIGHRTIVFQ